MQGNYCHNFCVWWQVVKVRPNDKDARMKYQECNKIVKQKAFERAIASDDKKKSVVDSLDIESMSKFSASIFSCAVFNMHLRWTCSLPAAIEDDYVGPKLEDGKVTLQFMKDMMDWFKDQKKLHRKCAYQVNPVAPRHQRALHRGSPNLSPSLYFYRF